MKLDWFIDTDGFKYCCRFIPYAKIQVSSGVIYNKQNHRIVGKKAIVYKHYIKDGKLLEEPYIDMDIYEILGAEDGEYSIEIFTNKNI